MIFSSSEKAAILRLFVLIIGADNHIDKKEMALSALYSQKLGITPAEIELSKVIDNKGALLIVSGMSDEEKKIICALLGELAIIDGEVAENERVAWSVISEICGFPKMSIVEAHEIVQTFFNQQ